MGLNTSEKPKINQTIYTMSWDGKRIESGEVMTEPTEKTGGFWICLSGSRTAYLKRGDYHLTAKGVAEEHLAMLGDNVEQERLKFTIFKAKAIEKGWLD